MKKAKAVGAALLYFAIFFAVQIVVVIAFALTAVFDVGAKISQSGAFEAGEIYDAVVAKLLSDSALITLISNFAFVALIFIIFAIRKKNPFIEVGFAKTPSKNAPASIFLGFSLNILTNAVFSSIPFPEKWVESYENAVSPLSDNVTGTVLLAVLISAPLAEEILFRGLIFTRMSRGFGVFAGAVTSALMFGLAHGNIIQCIYAALLGAVIVWVFYRTRSLICPILLHFAFNGIDFFIQTINVKMIVMALVLLVGSVGALILFNKKDPDAEKQDLSKGY